MGVSAYRRGSISISRQICQETGCGGCWRCRESRPTPRPDGWGDKALARATQRARRILAGCERYGLPRPDAEMLAEAVRERERVGAKTAMEAARAAIALI